MVGAMEGQRKCIRSMSESLDSSKNSDSDQPFKRWQLSLEESFHKDVVSDEMLRKTYLR